MLTEHGVVVAAKFNFKIGRWVIPLCAKNVVRIDITVHGLDAVLG
jgi:hypothetical protein